MMKISKMPPTTAGYVSILLVLSLFFHHKVNKIDAIYKSYDSDITQHSKGQIITANANAPGS
jgi:hypothetical protein